MSANINQLVLSLFSGVGLLDEQFRQQGFTVVSAGDLITGQDIRTFKSIKGRFDGILGGPPCQDFSALKRIKTNYSKEMLEEYCRIVTESDPSWFLMENVKGVPDIEIEGYHVQRLDINQGWYDQVSRLRHIQFGSKDGQVLDIERGVMRPNCKPLALASDERSFAEMKHIQGLPDNYDLPDFTVSGKKKAVGNGVPVSIARELAIAVKTVTHRSSKTVTRRCSKNVTVRSVDSVTPRGKNTVTKQCICGCCRSIYGRKKYYDSSCRKRAQRKRDATT